MRFDIGESVEVQGNAREGFPGAWCTAKIVAKDVGFVTVVYEEFLEEDGQQILESVEWMRVRPPLEDDSLTVPLYMRYQGEAVDCLAKDCWWEGHVDEIYPDHVTVKFPVGGEPPYRVYPIEAGVVPEDGEEPYRLRTTKHYNARLGLWTSVPPLGASESRPQVDSSTSAQSCLCSPATPSQAWDLWAGGL